MPCVCPSEEVETLQHYQKPVEKTDSPCRWETTTNGDQGRNWWRGLAASYCHNLDCYYSPLGSNFQFFKRPLFSSQLSPSIKTQTTAMF